MPDEVVLEGIQGPRGERVLVRRSARRRRTVSLTRRQGDLLLAVPAALSRREERRWALRLIENLARQDARRPAAPSGDAELLAWAEELSQRYLEGRARPSAVTWSARQQRRWGSCTPSSGRIRLSTQLQGMPAWVIRAVLMHELVHLLEPGHGPAFRALLDRMPDAQRAEAFLAGVSWAREMPMETMDVEPE